MKRRAFIAALGGAAAWPLRAHAQQAAMPLIGYLSGRSPDAEAPLRIPFLKTLEELGFTAGRTVAIEYRFAEGQDDRLPALAADLVRERPAVITAMDTASALAAPSQSNRGRRTPQTRRGSIRRRPACRAETTRTGRAASSTRTADSAPSSDRSANQMRKSLPILLLTGRQDDA